jgi:hypothetical protein
MKRKLHGAGKRQKGLVMKKIPVETTIIGAYRFLFERIVTVVGTLWFPYLLLAVFGVGLAYLIVPHDWLIGNPPIFDPEHFDPGSIDWSVFVRLEFGVLAFGVMALLAAAMVVAGLMRSALGLKKTATYFYFSLGAPVWRMLIAYVLYIILFAVTAVVLTLAVGLGAFLGLPAISGIPYLGLLALQAVAVIAAFLLFIYAALRMAFFLPAVVVAEGKIGLCRAWKLGKGNFWRIFVTMLLILLPVWIVCGIVLGSTVFPAVFGETTKLVQTVQSGKTLFPGQVLLTYLHAIKPVLSIYLTVILLARIASLGLMVGAAGTAYNALKTSDDA